MQYISRRMRGELRLISAAVLLIVALAFFMLTSVTVRGTTSTSGSETSLMIWDSTDAKAGPLARYSGENVTFYANFTNVTDGSPAAPIGGTNCNITFNTTGTWLGPFNMSYASGSGLYEYNSTFSWKGLFDFNVSCMANSSFSNEWLNVTDNYTITNSYPSISPKPLPAVTCYEDSCGTYNFSANCSDADANDVLSFSQDAQTNFTCFYMNPTTGIVDLSGCDTSSEAVDGYVMSLIVTDSDEKPDIADQSYTVIAVNDEPVMDISDCTAASPGTQGSPFNCSVTASDEEDGSQASGNLNFTANVTWFIINLTSGWVSFTPTDSEIGIHHINITVNDTGNATDSALLSLQIVNINDAPIITWSCYNTSALTGTNTTENAEFTCLLNASDVDSGDGLTFSSNTSWFVLNASNQSSYDGLGNFSAMVNFTASDNAVGTHQINISVTDDSGESDWRLINFSVFDVPDIPVFLNIANGTNITGYEQVRINFLITASDNDTNWNSSEYINFTQNQTSLFNFTHVNTSSTRIYFVPNEGDAGAFDIRINATDGNGNVEYVVINLTIYDNSLPHAPNITLACHDANATYNVSCYYNLSQNVTEPDGDNFNFTGNSTFFSINATTGEINFTANDSMVGNHSIQINITDGHGAINFTMISLEVRNVNDAPSLGLMNWTAYQTVLFHINLANNVSDQDTNISSGVFNETFAFTATNASNTSQSLMQMINMTSNGTVYLRPNLSHIGNYSINITVNDSSNVTDSQVINFTIYAYNNPPQLTYVCNSTRQATENVNFTCWVNATDIDSSNLTFRSNASWFALNTTTQPINTTNPNASSLVNFTAGFSEVGNHSVRINVTDDEGKYDEAIIGFEVLSQDNPPTIDWWRWITDSPVDLSSSDTTAVTEFLSTENSSIIFTHTSTDPDADTLTYSWLVNGTQNAITANLTYVVPFDYANSSIMNMTLVIDDQRGGYDQQEWNVTIIHVNLPPTLYKNIRNQTWAENTIEALNISDYMTDPDGDNLTFTYNLSPDCEAISCMNITFSGTAGDYEASLSPATNWWGITNATITASDSEYNATSNSFQLNVTYVPRQVQYIYVDTSSSGGGGSGGTSSQIASLAMTIEPVIVIEPNKILRAPIFLENTGEVSLNTINLSAEADGDDISILLAHAYFESIGVSNNTSTYMTINITNAKKDTYEIRAIANVSSPAINETATLILETTPVNRTVTDVRIEFVKDLFEDNPECMELMELVFEAEDELGEGNLGAAQNLTKVAIDNCRDLIKYGQVTGRLMPSGTQPLTVSLQPLEIAVVFIIAISAWYAIGRAIRSRYHSKRKSLAPQA